MHEISNEQLRIQIVSKGAELQSVLNKNNGIEYLWQGDAAYWGKRSPVLFPIVGGLKKNQFLHNGKAYTMLRHGFARDREFPVTQQQPNSISFQLGSDAESMAVYPFEFVFTITYSISNNTLQCNYCVVNTGTSTMYFSVGAHPAFNVPLGQNTEFSDWRLEFSSIENTARWPLSEDGLLLTQPEACLNNTLVLPLKKELFYTDALVFKQLQSTTIALANNASPYGLKLHAEGFPYYGIWSAKNANFICLEPWCGVADGINSSGELKNKEGINPLEPGDSFNRAWTVEVF
ncbi:MAG TPA: aldose 1-epimerase family protein [Ferruginibacter sp.]|nr:aldose 1-epimerase family protein [Ferruginibacter sp.]HMP20814.1 aldose 1-epimerase family protein [Ferruginibacter sp.]